MAEETKKKSWQVPKFGNGNKGELHQWAMSQVKNGLDILEASPGFQQLDESIRILTGSPTSELEKKQRRGYSKAQTNRLKRNLREMVNTLAEIRYNPAFKGNRETHDTAETLNKFGEYWYSQEFIDLQVKKAIQWMAIGPCGWLEITYRQFPGQLNKKEIACIPHSWFDVVMTGLPETGDFQEAYTVTIIKEYPVYLAHALHPEAASDGKLQPDKTGQRGVWAIIKEKAKQALRGVFGEPEQEGSGAPDNPSVTLYEMRVLDLSINRSQKRMKMGYEKTKTKKKVKEKIFGIEKEVEKEVEEDVATPWSYEVPYVGEMMQSGYDEQGQPTYKAAKPEQCRIFPGRRLLIDSETDNIYDGPDFNFHGRQPLVKFAADAWPFGDFSMVHDVAPIHEEIQEIDRISNQTLRNRFNPTMGYNMRAVDRDKAKTVRLDIQGDRIGFNGEQARTIADAMSPLVGKDFNVIESWVMDRLKYLVDEEDYQMGVRNFEALAKLKIGASGDSIDKLLEAAGPIVKGISRDMERQMRDLADLFKYLVFQYKTTADFILITGVDRVTPINFDYEPGNMIPSHLPDEKKSIQLGLEADGVTPITKPLKSIYSRMERARWAAEHIKFFIAPGTLHEITQTAHKMLLLQLWRAGAPVDPWTLFEALKVGDLGPVPEGANSMLEKWHAFKMMEVEFQAALAAKMKALMGDEGGGMPNAPNLGGKGGQKGTGGRPASAQASPKLAQKDGGSRTIVRESN